MISSHPKEQAATVKASTKTASTVKDGTDKQDDSDELDELESLSSVASKETTGQEFDTKEDIQIAQKESRHVLYTRAIMLLVLIGVATAVSVMVYVTASDQEQDSFIEHFYEVASKLSLEFQGSAFRCIEATEGLSSQITTYAISSNSAWPNVVIPEFERRVKYVMEVSEVQSVTLFPVVDEADRQSWEAFSVSNQEWLVDGLAVQGIPRIEWDYENIGLLEDIWGETPGLDIPEQITKVGPDGAIPDDGPGPYAPMWQFAPVFPVPSLVNYNGFTHHSWNESIQSVITYKEPLLARVWDHSDYEDPLIPDDRAMLDLFIEHAVGGHKNYSDYQHGPTSLFFVPVMESYDDDAAVVAVLSSFLVWQDFFDDVLLDDDFGIFVVLSNSCNQTYTFRLDGASSVYLGPGDRHEAKYDAYKMSIDLGAFVEFEYGGETKALPEGQCLYNADVYPSTDFEESQVSNEPQRFAIILACTFVFTCSVFLLYDWLVERRQRLVLKTAVRSESVVASLFPKGVRDRMYANKEGTEHSGRKGSDKNAFLSSNHKPNSGGRLGDSATGLEYGCKAIADLYPECTILFMDVAGFTQWSSSREPWQVFKLLETMYKAFDRIASRLVVFKVETIGDCYLAVTGIPHAQPDHAVIMAKFATECNLRVGRILHRLVDTLGEDTLNLRLRTGLHSGPVTAGVLRGAKARFQLFGDTVNTAARMESTGQPAKIQISSETADLLVAAGKSSWIRKREEEVLAKGKGNLQTWWLEIQNVDCSRAGSCVDS